MVIPRERETGPFPPDLSSPQSSLLILSGVSVWIRGETWDSANSILSRLSSVLSSPKAFVSLLPQLSARFASTLRSSAGQTVSGSRR